MRPNYSKHIKPKRMLSAEKINDLNRHFDVEELLTPGQVDALIKGGYLFLTTALFDFADAARVFGTDWVNENTPFEGVRMFGGMAISPVPLIIPNGWEIDQAACRPDAIGIYEPAGFAAAAQVMAGRGFNEFMSGPLAASIPEAAYDQTSLN